MAREHDLTDLNADRFQCGDVPFVVEKFEAGVAGFKLCGLDGLGKGCGEGVTAK